MHSLSVTGLSVDEELHTSFNSEASKVGASNGGYCSGDLA